MLYQSASRQINLKNVKAGVKDAPGTIFAVHFVNLDAAIQYLQLYDAKLANVTVGTTVPTLTIPLAASGQLHVMVGADDRTMGWFQFQNGLTLAFTVAADGSGAAPTNGGSGTFIYA